MVVVVVDRCSHDVKRAGDDEQKNRRRGRHLADEKIGEKRKRIESRKRDKSRKSGTCVLRLIDR